jgi:hypothetical protein
MQRTNRGIFRLGFPAELHPVEYSQIVSGGGFRSNALAIFVNSGVVANQYAGKDNLIVFLSEVQWCPYMMLCNQPG